MSYTPEEITEILEAYFDSITHRQYIGSRYVPIFGRVGESSCDWDNTGDYEPLTIVLYQGNSYTSRQFVPAGADISNTDYWVLTGNFNAQVEQYRLRLVAVENMIPSTSFDSTNTVKKYIDNIANVIPVSDFDDTDTVKKYIDQDISKVHVFETVAEMKTAANLTSGAVCRTNGFHSAGDEGAAWYEIESQGDANEMDVIALENGLVAVLVFDNVINVKQLGAMGDGVSNDSVIMKYAFDKANTLIDSDKNKIYEVSLGNGAYYIDDAITLKFGIRINVKGHAKIVSGITQGYLFKIEQANIPVGTSFDSLAMYGSGELVTGGSLSIVGNREHMIDSTINTTAIQLSDFDTNDTFIKNLVIDNMNIYGFTQGIFIADSYIWGITIKQCEIRYCSVGIEHGNNVGDSAEERYSAISCDIDGCCIGVLKKSSASWSFINCSFDYNGTHIVTDSNAKSIDLFVGCHFEGQGNISTTDVRFNDYAEDNYAPYSYCYADKRSSDAALNVNFIGCKFVIGRTSVFTDYVMYANPSNNQAHNYGFSTRFNFEGCSFDVGSGARFIAICPPYCDVSGTSKYSYNSFVSLGFNRYGILRPADGTYTSTSTALTDLGYASFTSGDNNLVVADGKMTLVSAASANSYVQLMRTLNGSFKGYCIAVEFTASDDDATANIITTFKQEKATLKYLNLPCEVRTFNGKKYATLWLDSLSEANVIEATIRITNSGTSANTVGISNMSIIGLL